MKAKDLMGRKVYDKDAIEIGKVSDLELDVSSFTIQKIYIKSGMMSGHHVAPQDVDRIGDSIILNVSKGELKT
ncbi:MAG: PRC-barrel domain-containing protein [Theionarchaea archaeon]|nr:PRC-barrel domain-containing protein [Theionarchaea archaeon]